MRASTTLPGSNAWMAREQVDAAFLIQPATIAHLTGFRAETMERLMALAVSGGEVAVLIVPGIEEEPARADARGVRSWAGRTARTRTRRSPRSLGRGLRSSRWRAST